MCVEKCPDDYYVDGNYQCQSCENSNGENTCIEEPLKFAITIFEKNYVLFAEVKFNRKISLTKK